MCACCRLDIAKCSSGSEMLSESFFVDAVCLINGWKNVKMFYNTFFSYEEDNFRCLKQQVQYTNSLSSVIWGIHGCKERGCALVNACFCPWVLEVLHVYSCKYELLSFGALILCIFFFLSPTLTEQLCRWPFAVPLQIGLSAEGFIYSGQVPAVTFCWCKGICH